MKIIFFFLFFTFSFSLFGQDTIVVEIVHGSKPSKSFKDEYRTIGGKKGGHVVIQMDGFVYGFFFKGSRIHIFPHKKKKNGTFQKQSVEEWNKVVKDKKVTFIYIPVTKEEKQSLIDFYNANLVTPSYDYSFFGQRCASSVYEELKSIRKIKNGNYLFNAFYPGKLRKKLIKASVVNSYTTKVKDGSKKRIWEGN